MLIDSDFHDYYDTALAHGVDKTCVYNRRTERIDVPRHPDNKIYVRDYRDVEGKFFFRPYVIGFAGDLYPMIAIGSSPRILHDDDRLFYEWEPLAEYLDERVPVTRKYQNKFRFHYYWHSISDRMLQAFFDPATHAKHEARFREHRVPLFVVVFGSGRSHSILLNPRLKDYRFMRIKDPYTAMQEIHMFLSGVLGGLDRDMAEVENDDRVAQRGFDKWSFRQEPRKDKHG